MKHQYLLNDFLMVNQESTDGLVDSLVSRLKDLVSSTLENVKKPDFFTKNNLQSLQEGPSKGSGLTKASGWYMVYNKRTGKFNFGYGTNLSLRKAYYKQDLKEFFKNLNSSGELVSGAPTRFKLYPAICKDILESNSKMADFYFIPLLCYKQTKFIFDTNFLNNTTLVKAIENFLQKVEKPVLTFLLQEKQLQSLLYNVKDTGRFEQGNTYGGSPNSGKADKPLAEQDNGYAWESVTVCANFLGVSNKAIRHHRGDEANKSFKSITKEEWENWPEDLKITRSNSLSEYLQKNVKPMIRKKYRFRNQ